MNFVEFTYMSEDSIEMTVKGQGRVVYQSNYGADMEDHKGYPMKYIQDMKFTCESETGENISKDLLTDDDKTDIEDIIHNTLVEMDNEPDYISDFYDRFDD